MRKLIILGFIILAVALTLAALSLYSPDFKATLYDFGVNTIGGGIVNGATGLTTGVMAWGATGLTQAVTVIAGTLLIGGLIQIFILRKYVWPHVPGVAKKVITTAPGAMRGGPEPELPQTIEQVPSEVKKEET